MKEKNALLYHFSTSKMARPKIFEEVLHQLETYADSLGYTVKDTFCDMSNRRCDRTKFDYFLYTADQYDALFVQDFHHISKNTMKCMSIVKDLRLKGIKTYTLFDGCIEFEEAPFNKHLKIATYNCRFGSIDTIRDIMSVSNDVLTLFASKNTNWDIVDQYFDESENQNDGEQPDLQRLIENKDNYDLILVHNLNDIHWRTANFIKVREALHLDIYSLQEGFLEYRKE